MTTQPPPAPAEAPAPTPFPAPLRKIRVTIATPLRQYRGPDDLPKVVGAALRELASRGQPQEVVIKGKSIPVNYVDTEAGEKARKDDEFHAQAARYEFTFMAVVGGLCRARNEAVREFLAAGDMWLLWWDADLVPDGMTPGEAVLRLLAHRCPVVGGIYCKRGKRPQWAVTWLPCAEEQPKVPGVVQVVELAGGFKLYHRQVFTEIARLNPEMHYIDRDSGAKAFAFYQMPLNGHDLLTEDYFLDYIGARHEIFPMADMGLKLRHVGPDGTSYPEGEFPPIPLPKPGEFVEVPLAPRK